MRLGPGRPVGGAVATDVREARLRRFTGGYGGPAEESSGSDVSSAEFELEREDEEPHANASASGSVAQSVMALPGRASSDLQPEDADEVPECAVCCDVLWDAVILPSCGHRFCRACLGEVCRRGEARCPLCRTAFPAAGPEAARAMPAWLARAPSDADLEWRLREHDPETWHRRRAEAELRAASSVSLLVGNRCGTHGGSGRAESCHLALFVEVIPPSGWRPRRPGGPGVTALLIESVSFTLPAGWPDSSQPLSTSGTNGVVEVQMAPFELSHLTRRDEGGGVARMRIAWKRRLGLPPLDVEHVVQLVDGGAVARHEASLPEGLTLARVLERSRPVARIGVGSRMESEIHM